MTNTLPLDTYYRGYRLSSYNGQVHIWYGCDKVEVVDSTAIAHEHIDTWQEAK